MTWPLELFGTQFNAHRAALLRGNAAEVNYAKSVKGLQDSARTTWIAYQSAQSRVSYVSNQVEIARQFLALAQKEAQKARGQMMLVVNAQNALVNAQKDLENANTDFAMQVFSMLSQVNALSMEALQTAAAAEAEAMQEARKQYQERLKKFQDELKKAQEGADNAPAASTSQ